MSYRIHTCGELTSSNIGETTKLAGWCHVIRDHGGIFFVDLRDHYGITQCVIDPQTVANTKALKSETVISVSGTVKARPVDAINKNISTGEIELVVTSFEVLGAVETNLPLIVSSDENYPEDIRLKYRFLDLRRTKPHANIMKRMEIIKYMRRYMEDAGFFEFQTPILTASSPEGARDFLIPSRLHPGQFYALPQAPQQFKQLLMVSGFDRYFQIAPCFRDEAARSDRSPGEFYQLDIEMSFVEQEDVFDVIEPLMLNVFKMFGNKRVMHYIPKIPYREAMVKYGSDKPDLRNPIEIVDVTDIFSKDGMTLEPFKKLISEGAVVRAIPSRNVNPNPPVQPRRYYTEMESMVKDAGGSGLAYITYTAPANNGPMAKFLSPELQEEIRQKFDISNHHNGGVFFVVDKPAMASKLSALVRDAVGKKLEMIDEDCFEFCWIVDFPMFEWNEEEKRVDFSHNPFSMPQGGMDALDNKDPLDILAYQYDIVCNGIELSSGAIRNHRADIMEKAFAIAGYDKSVLEEKFGGMLNAFKMGAPPHGGIAPGIDRIVMMICEEENLREVVLFPMNQRGQDLMLGAPSFVDNKQLKELALPIRKIL